MSKALILAVMVVNLISVISGYCLAVINRAVPYLQTEFNMSDSVQRWALDSLFFGAFLVVLSPRPAKTAFSSLPDQTHLCTLDV